jgi:hypothetical protein
MDGFLPQSSQRTMPTKLKQDPDGIFTIIRLAYEATVERACELAGIGKGEVDLVQRVGEKAPANLPENFRIVSFDGAQMTISERINGERRVRGFAVDGDTTTMKERFNPNRPPPHTPTGS